MSDSGRAVVELLRQRVRQATELLGGDSAPMALTGNISRAIDDAVDALRRATEKLYAVEDPAVQALARALLYGTLASGEVRTEWNAVRVGTDPDTVDPLMQCDDEERAAAVMSAFCHDGRRIIYRRAVTYGPWRAVDTEGGEPS